MNRDAWLALLGSFAGAFLTASLVAVGFIPDVLVLSAIAAGLFALCSVGMLFRHRPIALRTVVSLGMFFGIGPYAATWALWRVTAPDFRHAVPFDLLPLVLSALFGLAIGVSLFIASSE